MLISTRLAKLVPRRLALLVGFGIAAMLFWTIGNGLLLRTALHELDSSYHHVDALLPAELSAPEDPSKSGSCESFVSWAGLGAQGRERVVAVPSKGDIASLTGGSAMEPLRVYVGLNSAETIEQRAERKRDVTAAGYYAAIACEPAPLHFHGSNSPIFVFG
jgi:uncharacterized membrane protein